ncbi:MAG: WecB/TagA/CpsF family glycosyltransferase [Gammaproteobacteria bacterium]|nr:WecB/TagA/CpsF family glycosyltransferase [Gammaproteobacteria bacterium]
MNLPKEYAIDFSNEISIGATAAKSRLSYNIVSMASDVLLLVDLPCLLLASLVSSFLYTHWLTPLALTSSLGKDFEQIALVAAVLAPFMLHDKRFGSSASRGRIPALVSSYIFRFTLFAAVILGLGVATQALSNFPQSWLAMWFSTSLLLTSCTRVLMAQYIRHLQRQGVLTEVVAVVGAGPVADRLVQVLRQTRADTIEVLGVFDDKIHGAVPSKIKAIGSLEQLLEIGKTRKIDWILLTLPPTAEKRLLSIVHRLKALSVPIGLCPQSVGLTLPCRSIDYVGASLPVSLLADRPLKRWDTVMNGAEKFLPRWIVTLALLPLVVVEALADKLVQFVPVSTQKRTAPTSFQFDNYDLDGFTQVAAGFGQEQYGYAVTPNTDHVIRLHENTAFRAIYAAANYILLDSRFLAHVLQLTKGMQLPVCTGSDLTEKLFARVIAPDDSVVVIGGPVEQAQKLCARYGLKRLAHFNPPMGFIRDPEAVETCLRFIESHSPFRFCFLAVGCPQAESIALQLKTRGKARGLALCIGAAINFLTGMERRAPLWMQRSGMEWLFRLMQSPGRLAKRYLVRGPRVFQLLRHAQIVLRNAPAPSLAHAPLPRQLAQPEPRLRLVKAINQPVVFPSAAIDAAPMHAAEQKNRASA